jgi:chromosome partitioning protein
MPVLAIANPKGGVGKTTLATHNAGWDARAGETLKPPRGTTHVVLDTPAGLHVSRARRRCIATCRRRA